MEGSEALRAEVANVLDAPACGEAVGGGCWLLAADSAAQVELIRWDARLVSHVAGHSTRVRYMGHRGLLQGTIHTKRVLVCNMRAAWGSRFHHALRQLALTSRHAQIQHKHWSL